MILLDLSIYQVTARNGNITFQNFNRPQRLHKEDLTIENGDLIEVKGDKIFDVSDFRDSEDIISRARRAGL